MPIQDSISISQDNFFQFPRSQHVMEENVAIARGSRRDNRFAVITFYPISLLISSLDSDRFLDSDARLHDGNRSTELTAPQRAKP